MYRQSKLEIGEAKVDWHIRNFLRLCTLGEKQTANEGTHQLETHGGRVSQVGGYSEVLLRTKLMDKMMVALAQKGVPE